MHTMPAAQWVDLFALKMGRLEVRAEPYLLVMMAEELYPTLGDLPPDDAAQAEYDEWPPHDD